MPDIQLYPLPNSRRPKQTYIIVQLIVLASLAQLLGHVELARFARFIQIKKSVSLCVLYGTFCMQLASYTVVLLTEPRGGSSTFRPQHMLTIDSVAVGRKCIVCVHTTFF